jgi:hypothetical protein
VSENYSNAFVWWFGVVEDVDDPLLLGRARVRCYGFHTLSDDILPTSDLPWAHVIMPTTSASFQGKGMSPTFLRVGSTVFGFFADGSDCQMPMILGSYHGIPQDNPEFVDGKNLSLDKHDVNDLARGRNKIGKVKEQNGIVEPFEPKPFITYGTRYPHNKVFESESGHVIEVDDTPGEERIHIFHMSGHYTEMVGGSRTDKVNGNHIEIVVKDKMVKINGSAFIVVEGNTNLTCESSINMKAAKSINLESPVINIRGSSSVNIKAGTSLSAIADGITAIKGKIINLN